ncbi:MAG TPA: asparagine synthase-related protein [Gemmatimonadaceae bacterium]
MSAVLGVFDTVAGLTPPRRAASMLAAMARRGAESRCIHCDGSALLGASRFAWELDPGFAGPALIARDDALVVAADATLYYRHALKRRLRARGVRVCGETPGDLILAAYRAWGTECPRYLEGDFAFVLWDARTHTVFAARDFAGKRPLFHARIGGSLVIASEIAGILAHPECSRDLNVAVIAEEAAVLTGSRDETCWRAVRRLAPGHSLTWRVGGAVRTTAHWTPPVFRDRGGEPFDAAAEELRARLGDAVRERFSPSGRTVVCLSGGWDSPAVYAAGRDAMRDVRDECSLDAVSVSFPPGDPGREDELIERILGHWNAEPAWIRSDDIPPLDRLAERAAERDEPFPHPFEMMNRAMAAAARARGARVMLDGNGGDLLFAVSSIYLLDLFRSGRWMALTKAWRAQGGGGVRALASEVMLPALPGGLRRVMAAARRDATFQPTGFERVPPVWLRTDFLKTHDILERERQHVPRYPGRSLAARETAWELTRPVLGRMASYFSAFALEAGVELRSPLCDARLVRFAATRPVSDRRSARETKRLLRRAMTGLLPADVLAPRAHRTGVPSQYLTSAVHALAARTPREQLRTPLLAEIGIVDPAAVERAWAECLRSRSSRLTIALLVTLEVEQWVRAHAFAGRATRSAPTPVAVQLSTTN